jgi:hypothetical protein
MDSQDPNMPADELEYMEDEEEVEVTREELIAALQDVVTKLSSGLKGGDREVYLSSDYPPEDYPAQNDWFFAGASDEEGQFAVTMWPAEGEEDMLRIDIGTEEEAGALAENPDQIAALTDDFIDAMSDEEFEYEDYEEEDEDEEEFEEGEEDEEDEEEELDEEFVEEEEFEEDLLEEPGDETTRNDGTRPM